MVLSVFQQWWTMAVRGIIEDRFGALTRLENSLETLLCLQRILRRSKGSLRDLVYSVGSLGENVCYFLPTEYSLLRHSPLIRTLFLHRSAIVELKNEMTSFLHASHIYNMMRSKGKLKVVWEDAQFIMDFHGNQKTFGQDSAPDS